VDLFDLIIALAAVAYAIGGFRSGALVGIFSLLGFFAGASIGAQLADPIGSKIADGRAQVPVAVFCVLLLAMAGQLLGVWIAGQLRHRVMRDRGRPVDAGLGAVLGVLAVLIVSWMIAVPLASSPYPQLAAEAGHSKIVRTVDGVMPDPARNLYASMRDFLDQSGFPPVFGDLPSTSITPVAPPPTDLSATFRARIEAARPSILKVYSQAPECSRGIEGSGFVYAPHRLLTNAHVVAGSRHTQVQLGSGKTLDATVVVYDPGRDVAVLDVPGLKAAPLGFAAQDAKTGDTAAVIGYPEDGPFTVRSARVRGKTTVRGNDIYGHGNITRSIYSIRATVREGNSGGPLLAPDGTVLGIVFATARDSADTGFVLTDDEVAGDANAGRSLTRAVATGDCTPD
jgi:S1-C subfamily serine protease